MSVLCLPGVPLRWARLPSHQLPPSFHVPAHLWGVLPDWNSRGQHADRGKWLRIQTEEFIFGCVLHQSLLQSCPTCQRLSPGVFDGSQVPLSSICYHGSRLVQALARFKERSHLLSSLRTLSPANLLTLASDPAGSHVLQALITTSSDKGRGKILKRLEVWWESLTKALFTARGQDNTFYSKSFSDLYYT